MSDAAPQMVLALSGGVGGAKLSLGLSQVLPPERLHILVNTGDDFQHMGLHISPDIDTHIYTLSGRSNRAQGWGLEGETRQTMAALEELGGETWFRLGDRDMATHLWRTRELAAGRGLNETTAELAARLGVACAIHPMTEDSVRTTVHTPEGDLPFQHYFVRHQCEPAVTGFNFDGISAARPNRRVAALLQNGEVGRIVVCPSNPFVSIDPILQVPGLWLALRDSAAPVSLVSPIVAGAALKGPTAKMMQELDLPVTALGVAEHFSARYPGLVDHFVIDAADATLATEIEALGMQPVVTTTVMKSLEDRENLARFILGLGEGAS